MSSQNERPAPSEHWEDVVARKKERSRNDIPEAWKLPSTILSELSLPLEQKPNNILSLDIPRKSGILSERELAITENYSVAALLESLASGSLTALEVTLAFCKRAAIAQQLVGIPSGLEEFADSDVLQLSCLTEIFFDEAIQRAKALDIIRAEGKQPIKPLHGLPVSLKDTFNIEGHETSIGYVSFLDAPAQKNSHFVRALLELGAVLYVKTNLPQTVATGDSHNNIFGRTLNPWNTILTAGGSTGGEGALIAFRGSPLGIGTDLAGSIRIPAMCCGTYGFKPTASRLPHGGQASGGLPGLRAMLSATGPLANDFEALELLTAAVIDAEPGKHDVSTLDIPWRRLDRGQRKLRIGVLSGDPLYPLHPPVSRALGEVVDILRQNGHAIIDIGPSEAQINEASEVAWALLGLDPSRTVIQHILNSGEPFVPSVSTREPPATFGDFKFLRNLDGLDAFRKYAAVNLKRDELQESWMSQIWAGKRLDVVIGPVAKSTAVPHDTFGWPVYTVFANVLDYPVCVIPFSQASNASDPVPIKRKPGEGGPEYLPGAVDGAPCAIQLFTSRFRDEECLQYSRIIDKCIRARRS